MLPIGACAAVTVVSVTLSERVHREERASPQKPDCKDGGEIRERGECVQWCFNAVPKPITKEREEGTNNG